MKVVLDWWGSIYFAENEKDVNTIEEIMNSEIIEFYEEGIMKTITNGKYIEDKHKELYANSLKTLYINR